MSVLRGFTLILLFQCAGEIVSRSLIPAWPGPVIGMLLMAPALSSRALREPVAAAASALLPHLSLLFVPIGVGVVAHAKLIEQSGLVLLAVLSLSTWVGLAVTAWVLNLMWRRDPHTRSEEPRGE
jgi:holin-like protein